VTLAAKAGQRVLKAGALFVNSGCDEACILSVKVVVGVKGVKQKVSLITVTRTLKSARKTSFKVVFSARRGRSCGHC
jgi:hypothetical protein